MDDEAGIAAINKEFGMIVAEKKRFLANHYFGHDNKLRWPTRAITIDKFRRKKSVTKDAAIELVYKAYEIYHDNKTRP